MSEKKSLEDYIITIPDFPEPGIMFRDVTSILGNPDGLQLAVDELTKMLENVEFDAIMGLESRGFMFGCPVAYNMHKAFIPVRKKGKLPRKTISEEYSLEYGTAVIEIHEEDVTPGMKVVVVDDLIATGGTMAAAIRLAERQGAEVVKVVALLELKGLNGRELMKGYDVETVVAYDGK